MLSGGHQYRSKNNILPGNIQLWTENWPEQALIRPELAEIDLNFMLHTLKLVFLCFQEAKNIDPNESFAWKDSTLDRKLKELEERAKQQSALSKCSSHVFTNIEFSICRYFLLRKMPF